MSERARLVLALGLVASMAGGWYWLQRPSAVDAQSELEAAAAALDDWGEWAGDGDLSHLENTFADGPQLAQLRREDPAIEPGAPYSFVLEGGELVEPGVVRGTVVLSRPGETEQRFHWDLELVEVDGRWRLWTVRTSPDS